MKVEGCVPPILLPSCRKLRDARMRGIRTHFVQADEIWTFCGCHQRRFKPGAPAEWGDRYVWIALDSITKMVIPIYIGRRDGDSADAFVRDLSNRIDGRFQVGPLAGRAPIERPEEPLSSKLNSPCSKSRTTKSNVNSAKSSTAQRLLVQTQVPIKRSPPASKAIS